MAPASVQVVCMEPVVFLRGQSAVGEDARGRRRQIDFDAPPSQLRGLVTLNLPRTSRVKEITVTLQGKARTDWPEGIGPNRLDTVDESVIFKQTVTLYSARDTAPTQRPRASSIGPGIDWLKDDLAWPSPNAASGSRVNGVGPTTSGERMSMSDARKSGTAEASKSPKIARTITKTAAKAGAAILPPSLMGGGGSSNGNGNQSNRAQISPTLHRPSSGNNTVTTRSPLSTVSASSSTSLPGRESYFDPPPHYAGGGAQSDQSSPASAVNHPQSISAAGPGQRSILHSTSTTQRQASEQRARLTTTGESPNNGNGSMLGVAAHGVRFDPQAVNSAFEQEGVSPTSMSNRLASVHLSGQRDRATSGSSDSNNVPRSEPGSRRVSIDLTGKGKGKATPSPTSTPSVATTEKGGARRGIKSLLIPRRKDDDVERNKTYRSSTSDSNNTPSFDSPAAVASAYFSTPYNNEEEWREFPKGTHTYPFSIPLPSNLPPTLHADFGSNAYTLRAHVHRAGPLTANLTSETEVTLVHAPNEDGQDDIETIVVERNWEDALRYMIVVMGKSFPVGGRIPIWSKFVPMEKVRIHGIVATLEERTTYYAKGRKVARHEVPRRWTLLKVQPSTTASKAVVHQGILPILSEAPDAILQSPLAAMARSAALSYSDAAVASDAEQRKTIEGAALASLGDPTGPWELAMDLGLPKCTSTRINISSNHLKSNIAILHVVKLAIRVERLDAYKGVDPSAVPDNERQLFDILIEAPVAINHSHTANAWLTLPDYWSVPALDENGFEEAAVAATGGGGGGVAMAKSSSRASDKISMPAVNGSTTKGKSIATSSASTASDAARSAARLAQLGRQWLSLTGATTETTSNGCVQRTQTAKQQQQQQGTNNFTPQSAGHAVVTYAGNYGQQGEQTTTTTTADEYGLPTYAMIDNAVGSIDPPPSDRRSAARTLAASKTTQRQ